MEMTHAFAYANFDHFLSLVVVLHALHFSIYICRCTRHVLSLTAAGGGSDQVLAVMAAGGGINQVLAVASAKYWQWY